MQKELNADVKNDLHLKSAKNLACFLYLAASYVFLLLTAQTSIGPAPKKGTLNHCSSRCVQQQNAEVKTVYVSGLNRTYKALKSQSQGPSHGYNELASEGV